MVYVGIEIKVLLILPVLGRVIHYSLYCLHLHGNEITHTDARYCFKDFMYSIHI